jgi:hypothetical protein
MAAVEEACRAALAEADLPAAAFATMDAAVGLAGLGRKGVLETLMVARSSLSLGALCR